MRTYKLLLLTVALMAFAIAGCSKPPVQELDQAKTAMQAAKDSGAEKCQIPEYLEAKAKLEAAQKKMDEAEAGGKKGELYESAKADLTAAIADFEKAKVKADAYKETDAKVQTELANLRDNILRYKEYGDKYNLKSYTLAQENYDKAKELADKCQGEKALALIDEANKALDNVEEEFAAARADEILKEQERFKAEQMKQKKSSSENYTVVKGDNLWNISKAKYMNPFMWPIIYWTNDSMIKDPDLIYPGQVFKIMKDVAASEKEKAEKFSRSRGPWSLFDGK
jgi:nucleoid-associated protein YgaU